MELLKSIHLFTQRASRRKFIGVSAVVMGGLVAFSRIFCFTKEKRNTESKKAKFLTRDGRLVEVDLTNLPAQRKVASKQQLVSWVWKDQKL